MARPKIAEDVEKLLEGVALTDAGHRDANKYSGGMKRRLSVAIASVGNPKIIFLDEPTTGLDPLSRKRTWATIQAMKQGRVVCLTTHSMEEAEVLGDSVGILAHGRLRAYGSPIFLKNKFGSGYHVTVFSDDSKVEAIQRLIVRICRGGRPGRSATDGIEAIQRLAV